jgi:hypothetical protein
MREIVLAVTYLVSGMSLAALVAKQATGQVAAIGGYCWEDVLPGLCRKGVEFDLAPVWQYMNLLYSQLVLVSDTGLLLT